MSEASHITDQPLIRDQSSKPITRLIGKFGAYFIGILFCLTPPTAILVLGWLHHYMRGIIFTSLARRSPDHKLISKANMAGLHQLGARRLPHWIFSVPQNTHISAHQPKKFLGALRQNISTGLSVFLALSVATAPFSLLWLMSWWAGWENSFNKGYEQAWIGPSMGMLGVVFALIIFIYLPMALAHMAAHNHWRAFFEFKEVRGLIARAGWRYVALALVSVGAAVPLFGFKGLPVFIEQIRPGFELLSAQERQAFAHLWHLAEAVYIFSALLVLRWLSARIYIHALLREKRPLLVVRIIYFTLSAGIWFGLVAQVFVGQFLNHHWLAWLNHPLILLPVQF